jgi:hypothetical protein
MAQFIAGLCAGLLIGVIIEWAVDWQVWRRPVLALAARKSAATAPAQTAESETTTDQ